MEDVLTERLQHGTRPLERSLVATDEYGQALFFDPDRAADHVAGADEANSHCTPRLSGSRTVAASARDRDRRKGTWADYSVIRAASRISLRNSSSQVLTRLFY